MAADIIKDIINKLTNTEEELEAIIKTNWIVNNPKPVKNLCMMPKENKSLFEPKNKKTKKLSMAKGFHTLFTVKKNKDGTYTAYPNLSNTAHLQSPD